MCSHILIKFADVPAAIHLVGVVSRYWLVNLQDINAIYKLIDTVGQFINIVTREGRSSCYVPSQVVSLYGNTCDRGFDTLSSGLTNVRQCAGKYS